MENQTDSLGLSVPATSEPALREGMRENCPSCKVHRGHRANCPLADVAAVEPADYSLEAYRRFLRAKCNLPAEYGVPCRTRGNPNQIRERLRTEAPPGRRNRLGSERRPARAV